VILLKSLSSPRIDKKCGISVYKKSLWIGVILAMTMQMGVLSGCTLGSRYQDKNHLSKEKFIDLNSAPSPFCDRLKKDQSCDTYTSELHWLQREHQTLNTATPQDPEAPPLDQAL
jgi:hypothetical protein